MKTLYLECSMGAAGDMLMAALWELLEESGRAEFLSTMNRLGLPGVAIAAEPRQKCGIWGTHMAVTVHGEEEHSHDVPHGHLHEHIHEHAEHIHEHAEQLHEHLRDHAEHVHETIHEHHHDHEHHHEDAHTHEHEHTHSHGHHHHTSMADIEHILCHHMALPEQVRADALAVYRSIAEAESHAHNAPIDQIHFHEVGSMDAVADVVGVCLLMQMLAPEKVMASPVHVGSGSVKCAHGVLPVPAPATAYLLNGIPMYSGAVQGELCTPTGAALLRHFVNEFGAMPVLRVQKTGYGMGTKDFAAANCLRAMLGETEDAADSVWELSCNLDDMTAEAVAFAVEQLMTAGALDAFTAPITMKKGRPAVLLTCLCRPEQRESMLALLFRHTTTLGVRQHLCERAVLRRSESTVETAFGPVRVKRSEGWGVVREKPEFEDVAALAREHNVSLSEVWPVKQ